MLTTFTVGVPGVNVAVRVGVFVKVNVGGTVGVRVGVFVNVNVGGTGGVPALHVRVTSIRSIHTTPEISPRLTLLVPP
jgi:hypothetical protein